MARPGQNPVNKILEMQTTNFCLVKTEYGRFADDNLNVSKIILFAFERVENIVGK